MRLGDLQWERSDNQELEVTCIPRNKGDFIVVWRNNKGMHGVWLKKTRLQQAKLAGWGHDAVLQKGAIDDPLVLQCKLYELLGE